MTTEPQRPTFSQNLALLSSSMFVSRVFLEPFYKLASTWSTIDLCRQVTFILGLRNDSQAVQRRPRPKHRSHVSHGIAVFHVPFTSNLMGMLHVGGTMNRWMNYKDSHPEVCFCHPDLKVTALKSRVCHIRNAGAARSGSTCASAREFSESKDELIISSVYIYIYRYVWHVHIWDSD